MVGQSNSDPFVSIVMRSFNEAWALKETLPAMQRQEYRNWELVVIDSGSTDGSIELLRAAEPAHLVQIQPHEYVPGRVINCGVGLAKSEYVIFINADATPQGANWLRPLVNALLDSQTAAAFGRQVPRPDCRAVYAHDYERCFGENRESAQWDHFFSMASSGIRKDIWARRKFAETITYSEDDEWTRWCRAQGFKIAYVPESIAMHSHNYAPAQAYKRSFGEAQALAYVWTGKPRDINWPRTVALGYVNDVKKDFKFCARHGRLREMPHALRIRWQQRRARLAGFRHGWRLYRQNPSSPCDSLWMAASRSSVT
jgi:rhamnosyltransferase